MKNAAKLLVTLLFSVFLFGCPNPDPGDLTDIVAGTWSGDWDEVNVIHNSFEATVIIVRNGTVLTGTATTPINGREYTILGSITGSDVAGVLTYTDDNSYQITVAGTVSGDTMTGTWADNDSPQWGGSFVMTRE